MSERLEDTLRRLERERAEADRRYNDALTALDRAHPPGFTAPRPAAAHDEHQLPTLNEAWKILDGPPEGSGVKGRLAGFIWRTIAPYLQRQQTFNSLLVDHLNRTAVAARAAHDGRQALVDSVERRFAELEAFTSHLLVYLQQITAYVDTKDRSAASGALVLNSALGSMADDLEKRWQSLDGRLETRTAALASAHESLRAGVAVAQQASMTLKRELERLVGTGHSAATPPATAGEVTVATGAFAPSLDAYKYVGFEDRFRGSRDEIRRRLESYLPFFSGLHDVLDVGCGRGEFLELLRGAGIPARGIDVNHEMAELCRGGGLDVTEVDAVGYLSAQPDESLGGIFAAQVVEHLEPAYLLRFLELAYHKLRPGGRLLLETLNPACWVAFFDSYIRDITHVWPLHPDTLQYLVLASGFASADIEWRSPVQDQQKLQPLPPAADPPIQALVDTFNDNVEKLNARMFTYLDYAVVAEKGAAPEG